MRGNQISHNHVGRQRGAGCRHIAQTHRSAVLLLFAVVDQHLQPQAPPPTCCPRRHRITGQVQHVPCVAVEPPCEHPAAHIT